MLFPGKEWGNYSLGRIERLRGKWVFNRKSRHNYRLNIHSLVSYTFNRGWWFLWDWQFAGGRGELIKDHFQSVDLWLYKSCVWRCADSRVHASVNLAARSLMTAWVFVTVLFINKRSRKFITQWKEDKASPFSAFCMIWFKPTAELITNH